MLRSGMVMLRCPVCGSSPLVVEGEFEGERLREGKLWCRICERCVEVKNSVGIYEAQERFARVPWFPTGARDDIGKAGRLASRALSQMKMTRVVLMDGWMVSTEAFGETVNTLAIHHDPWFLQSLAESLDKDVYARVSLLASNQRLASLRDDATDGLVSFFQPDFREAMRVLVTGARMALITLREYATGDAAAAEQEGFVVREKRDLGRLSLIIAEVRGPEKAVLQEMSYRNAV